MGEVATALERVGGADARSRAGSWARRRHVQVLLAAVLLAALTRWVAPVPGVQALVGSLGGAFLAAALLLALGWALRAAAVPWLRVPAPRLAALLDDRQGWKDTLGTALDVERRGAAGAVVGALKLQATSLLAALPLAAAPAARPPRRLPWGRIGLAAVFVALLLLPGVSGRGPFAGAGRGGEIGLGQVERPTDGPYDADRWLRDHARLLLRPADPSGVEDPTGLVARFETLLPLPEPYAGDLALVLDGEHAVPLADVREARGTAPRHEHAFDLRAQPALAPHLAPGPHRLVVTLTPREGPWTQVLRSNEVELIVPPDGAGGGGSSPKPEPKPRPEPAPPPPAPAPTPGDPPPPPPMPEPEREEAVAPIVNEGTKVKKEAAVVPVRDPDAGLEPPKARPLAEALRDFEKVLEAAVGGERFSRRDHRLLLDYFRTLQRLTQPEPR
jgi:hypothetical protein